jgi:hypothetical protein
VHVVFLPCGYFTASVARIKRWRNPAGDARDDAPAFRSGVAAAAAADGLDERGMRRDQEEVDYLKCAGCTGAQDTFSAKLFL